MDWSQAKLSGPTASSKHTCAGGDLHDADVEVLIAVFCTQERRHPGWVVPVLATENEFTTWCPSGTPVETLVAVEGHRWAIEDTFETAKTELGLDHNETSEAVLRTLARLVPSRLAGDARLCCPRGHPPSRECRRGGNSTSHEAQRRRLVRWSL